MRVGVVLQSGRLTSLLLAMRDRVFELLGPSAADLSRGVGVGVRHVIEDQVTRVWDLCGPRDHGPRGLRGGG